MLKRKRSSSLSLAKAPSKSSSNSVKPSNAAVASGQIDITNKSAQSLPRAPFGVSFFKEATVAALGKNYELSLVFVNSKLSRKINRERRGKDKPTNILSFPLDIQNGEIFIDLDTAKKEAPSFDRSLPNFVAFLFIHGLMHLKGFDHGSTMERKEKVLRKLFDI